jgi:hypothetical protein
MKKLALGIAAAMLLLLPSSCKETQISDVEPDYATISSLTFAGEIATELSLTQKNSPIKTAVDLERNAIALTSKRLGYDASLQYYNFKNNTGFKDLVKTFQNSSKVNARIFGDNTPLSLSEACSAVSVTLLKDAKTSAKVNKYIEQFSKSIGNVAENYLKELEEEVIVEDGKKYIPKDKFRQGEYVEIVKAEVSKMPNIVENDKELNADEKKSLNTFIEAVNVNIDGIDKYFNEIFRFKTSGGRVAGFWDSFVAVFTNIVSAVITVVLVAVGVVVGFVLGGPWGAVAGFVIGASAGYSFSCDYVLTSYGPVQCDDCANFFGNANTCNQCKIRWPTFTGWTCDL